MTEICEGSTWIHRDGEVVVVVERPLLHTGPNTWVPVVRYRRANDRPGTPGFVRTPSFVRTVDDFVDSFVLVERPSATPISGRADRILDGILGKE